MSIINGITLSTLLVTTISNIKGLSIKFPDRGLRSQFLKSRGLSVKTDDKNLLFELEQVFLENHRADVFQAMIIKHGLQELMDYEDM